MSHNAYRSSRRDESLWAPLISTEGVDDGNRIDGLDVTSEDSEDELESLKDSSGSSAMWRRLQSTRSEDESASDIIQEQQQQLKRRISSSSAFSGGGGGGGVKDRLQDPALAKSWIRLENAPYVHFKQQQGPGGKDKWHEWFQMQKDWLNNVEQDPENYFDDKL